ncbi:MAG: nuclear transport factor 2 family protein [Deltaproteobacteria bacterium]|nr:nuclear transport factor 2 family protein [Deltaproteobacteria bacterium]
MRTVEEILNNHMKAIQEANLDEILYDYAEDAVLITKDTGAVKGKDALRQFFQMLTSGLFAGGQSTVSTLIIEGSLAYVEWKLESEKHTANGVDTFVVHGDKIHAQTGKLISFTSK